MAVQTGTMDPRASQVADAASQVADAVGNTVNYFRRNSTSDIWGDVQDYAKNNPAQALVAAAVVGFLVARLLRRG
jgi:ElaB/YqjD/DUF883 family membrane-anchored ribosome-binding protein